MRKNARRLYDLGLAIHWLRPKSKLPLESGWTKGARKAWADLDASFQPGYNVGVRLGQASRVGPGYLGLVDCDVKSKEPHHAKEMAERLKTLGLEACPVVYSGRGNGSRHYYFVSKIPVKGMRLSQSTEKVRVLMPSVKPSKVERETLSAKEIADGYRLRPAWEIALMGEGQQAALPPSIHPDSGHAYTWDREPESVVAFPLLNFGNVVADSAPPHREPETAVFEPVDLEWSGLDPRTIAMIEEGEDVEDRSAALLGVCNALCRAQFTDAEILSVLTDPNHFLGQVAYDHAQTKSRARAAEWIRRYTLEKVRAENRDDEAFATEVEERELPPEGAAQQFVELVGEPKLKHWTEELDRTKDSDSRPRPTLKNVKLILERAICGPIFRRDQFSGTDVYGVVPPWNHHAVGSEIKDIDIDNMVHWFVKNFRVEIPEAKVHSTVRQLASENGFHPVREYLETLEWDGRPRLDSWLVEYLGATGPREYVAAVGRKTLCAMIARVYNPGCKFDHVLILQGKQGFGKSTALRILSQPWFSDADIDITDKDAVLAMKSVWILELGELGSVKRADLEKLKGFVTRQSDRIRLPYGRLAENFPRQCVFVGSTNDDEYLRDPTGNRRFWPVDVGRCQFNTLERDRDQLLAEAYSVYHNFAEPLYLEKIEVAEQASEEQERRTFQDAWVEQIGNFLSNPERGNFPKNKFTLTDLFGDFGALPGHPSNVSEQMRAGQALRKLGFIKIRERKNGAKQFFWIKKN